MVGHPRTDPPAPAREDTTVLSNDIQELAEQATRAVHDAADATAYAHQTEQRIKALAHHLDDLTRRSRAQQTEVARVVSENVELRHQLGRAQGQQPATLGDG
jgi:ABC-type transporter Mla subunit MlaD